MASDVKERDPRTIEREIDRDRERVSETIDALRAKVSAEGLVDEIAKAISSHGGEITGGLGRAIRENPLPLLLTGIGLTWLMASSSERTAPDTRPAPGPRPDMGGLADRVSHTAAEAVGGVRDTVAHARDAGGQALGVAGGMASGAAGMARGIAGAAAEVTRDGLDAGLSQVRAAAGWSGAHGREIRQGFGALAEEQPLVVGALALALGAAIGGALPRTRTEDALLGAEADRLKAAARATIRSEGARRSVALCRVLGPRTPCWARKPTASRPRPEPRSGPKVGRWRRSRAR
ncbi:DUF3618 domain-containing protein [Amaricoccus sp. W119]|uniref:DUF3618 domain-containing protein n=1 Tax=Amaricoccus sp. W119 TaxID=3391833 RepID=UPI0039A4ACC6